MKRVIYHLTYTSTTSGTQILNDADALALVADSSEWFLSPNEARIAREEQLKNQISAEQAKLAAAQATAAKPKRKKTAAKKPKT